jgi:Fe-S oxidoreductase
MVENLRAGHKYVGEKLKSELHFAKDELIEELGQCSGCGVCLSREADLRMCPVYRALGEELGSSRAKVNILNLWMTGDIDEKQFSSGDFRKFLDLCVNCKACSLECPSGVDVSMLMSAARAEYVKRNRLRRTEFAMSHNRLLCIIGGMFSPLSTFVMKIGLFRWFLEKVVGIDSDRAMPVFLRDSFVRVGRKYLAAEKPIEKPVDKVAYFVDTFANYKDHELGFAVLKVLRHNDIEVILPD